MRSADETVADPPGITRRIEPMLDMKGACERCHVALPPASEAAMMCSFECTFCASCATGALAGRCPNCGGELVRRPRRPISPGPTPAAGAD